MQQQQLRETIEGELKAVKLRSDIAAASADRNRSLCPHSISLRLLFPFWQYLFLICQSNRLFFRLETHLEVFRGLPLSL